MASLHIFLSYGTQFKSLTPIKNQNDKKKSNAENAIRAITQ